MRRGQEEFYNGKFPYKSHHTCDSFGKANISERFADQIINKFGY